MSFLTKKINYSNIQAILDAAKALSEAGEDSKAEEILLNMANKIKREVK